MTGPISLGLVGARGHVGAELIRLVAAHPRFALAFVSSRERAGQRLAEHLLETLEASERKGRRRAEG